MNPEDLPLRDLHLPTAIGWWPLAPGWWLLIALASAGLLYLAFRRWQAWRHNRARRFALRQVDRIAREFAGNNDLPWLGKQLSELLRRGLLAYAPRDEIAGLTGERWLKWLDRGLETSLFVAGPGQAINELPYREPAAINADIDPNALLDAVRLRLRTPLPGAQH